MSIDPNELTMGIAAEKDHEQDKAKMCNQDDTLAKTIALRHLKEDPRYYSKLKKAGLEQEGAMTPLEAGLEECGDEMPTVAVIQVSAEPIGQTPLKSSGLGKGGTATPLKTSNIEAPAEKAKIGANKIVVGKTPTMSGNADPLDHYCGMIVKETGQYQYKDKKFANMAGVDNPNGDYGDDDADAPFKPNYGGAKKIKPQGDERGGPDDPDIDTPHMGR